MLSNYKYIVEKLLEKLFRDYNFLSFFSPNLLTVLGLFFSLCILMVLEFFIFDPNTLLLIIVFLILLSGLMDVLDGYVARRYNKVSNFGAFLDSTLDRISDAVYAYIFFKLNLVNDIFFLLLLTGFFLTSYSRARAEGIGIEMKGIGIVERSERILLIIGILSIAFFNKTLSQYGIFILLLLTWISVFQRILHVYTSTSK
ncbi:MAG: CDP-alcohol phosphatidyltransferase family protein [Thermoproteales archaeon]|nr:CDP-alcohol phosphatidyltransferase family protein [Thermoproteales archaeon]